MKITRITQQVKRAGRYSVYVDGKFSFGLGETQLITLGLHIGQEVSKEQIAQYKNDAAVGKLFDKTLNLLSFRPRSEWELRDYLKRKQTDSITTGLILNKLSNLGYIDDAKFAKRWIENRRLLKPISALKLRVELKQKHINNDVIDSALKADETDERAVLKEVIERKSSRYPDRQKFMQYLARQGFRYDDIKAVLSEN